MNVDPLPVTREIFKEEKEHDRVAGDYASEKKISLLTVMEKKQKKIHALMQGQTIRSTPLTFVFGTRPGRPHMKAGHQEHQLDERSAVSKRLPSTSRTCSSNVARWT